TWSTIRDRPRQVHLPSATIEVRLRVVFTVEGPTHIELIQEAPGSPWEGPIGLHHFGYWAHDVEGESARLEELGMPRVLTIDMGGPGGPWRVAYHRRPGAAGYIELVSSSVREEFQARLAGDLV